MTAAEFIKVRHPQDYDDIPQWHIDDLEAYAAQQKPPSSATAEEILQKYMDMSMIICPLHVVPRTVALDAMHEFAAQQQPTAEGAEEILESIVESLGDPINIHNHAFEIRPYTVEHKTEWWIFHKEVSSGEPLTQWLNEFATLHAQKIADKMVSEKLREELIKYEIHWNFVLRDNAEKVVDEYLKSRESHDNIR